MLDWLETWDKTVDWNDVEGGQPADAAPALADAAPRQVKRRIPKVSLHHRKMVARRAFFNDKLRDAQERLDQMERVLAELGRKLDAAQADEEVEVESAVDAIEVLIWRHNAALEEARAAWLRHNMSSRSYEQIARVSSPTALNLPRFVDKREAERAAQQEKDIGARLGQRIGTLDRTIAAMQLAENAGVLASLAVGGTVVFQAVRTGGKWAVVKTLAQVAASGAVAHGTGKAVEHGLRAAGASEETIHGVRLAAEVVTWLLLLRRVRAAGAKSSAGKSPETPRPGARKGQAAREGSAKRPLSPGIIGSTRRQAGQISGNTHSGLAGPIEFRTSGGVRGITPTRVASEIDLNKFRFVFGNVTSGSHNIARSVQNAAVMNRIGIHNTAAGQRHLAQHLDGVVQDPSNVVRTFEKTLPDGLKIVLEVRGSLLSGPSGFVKIESTWQLLPGGTRRLTTIIPFGG